MIRIEKSIETFLILSDLHLEFGPLAPMDLSGIDAVILAGDIEVKAKGPKWAREFFGDLPIIYVMGNHEYYGGNLVHTWEKNKANAEEYGVWLLENDYVQFDNVRVLGTTLWTDYRSTGNQSLAVLDAQQMMSDYRKIRDGSYRKIRPFTLLQKHVSSKAFLESTLEQSFDGATLVVTHHAPSIESIPQRYRDSKDHLNGSYASDLSDLLDAKRVQGWVHGHIHDSMDYQLTAAHTRIICNPRGYSGVELNPNFERKTVSVQELLEVKRQAEQMPEHSTQQMYEQLFKDAEPQMQQQAVNEVKEPATKGLKY